MRNWVRLFLRPLPTIEFCYSKQGWEFGSHPCLLLESLGHYFNLGLHLFIFSTYLNDSIISVQESEHYGVKENRFHSLATMLLQRGVKLKP